MNVQELKSRLKAPIIVAPMFLVSNPKLALACCGEGIVGSFPAHCTRTRQVFADWLVETEQGLERLKSEKGEENIAPYAVNIVCHPTNERMAGDIELVVEHKVPIVITSKSSPGALVERVHDYGGIVMSDIAKRRHAEKIAEAGVDAAIAVCAGAGGHTGSLNPFSFLNEIKSVYDGPTVLAGGMTTGRDVLASEVMGADFAYIGTRFINTLESDASNGHKQMIIDSEAIDILTTAAMDGAPAAFLTQSLINAGVDVEQLKITPPGEVRAAGKSKRWKDIWSAGHGVGNISDVPSAVKLARRLVEEYQAARIAAKSSL